MESVEAKYTRMMEQRRKASNKHYKLKVNPATLENLTDAEKLQREKILLQKKQNSKNWAMRRKAKRLAEREAKAKVAENESNSQE
tara:strand:+ start:657 stop:911 length:255 start_codon:yes stop_codon:yes gene_type:complete